MVRDSLLMILCSGLFTVTFASAQQPVVWYRYGTSGPATTLSDVSGNAHSATASGCVFTSDRPPAADLIPQVPLDAGSLSVDGGNDSGGTTSEINLLTNADVRNANGFTMETWFRRTAANNASGGFQKLLQIEIENFYVPSFSDEIRFSDGETPTIFLGDALVGQWHHVAAVFSCDPAGPPSGPVAGTMQFYFDGALLPGAPYLTLSLRDVANGPFWIGKANAASESFAGDLFETRVSLGALTRDQLLLPVTTPAPVANAGPDQTVNSTNPLVVIDGGASTGEQLQYEWFAPGNVLLSSSPILSRTFPVGTTQVTLKVTDRYGRSDYDDVSITVLDVAPPAISCMTDISVLSPPNNKLRSVTISVQSAYTGNDLLVSCVVTSNEPDDTTGDGAFRGDVNHQDAFRAPVSVPLQYNVARGVYTGQVLLRAERAGTGSGRIYSIFCSARTSSGLESAPASTTVIVPHDRGR